MGERIVVIGFEPDERDRELARKLEEFSTVYFMTDLDEPELVEVMKKSEVLVVGGWRGTIDSDMVHSMPKLRVIQTLGAGVNHIPFSSLNEHTVVSTGSGANTPEIAEHTFALLLSAAKNVVKHTEVMRKGGFLHGEESRILAGHVLGILGVGSIGSHVAKLAKGFGMEVYGCDVESPSSDSIERFYGVDELKDFLREVDFLVICVPLTKKTEGMIGKAELDCMRPDGLLVNVARGAVIRQQDLFEHLRNNPSFVAGLDVWWKYTRDKKFKQDLSFEELENVVMTPHNASSYPGHRERMVEFALDKVRRYLSSGNLTGTAKSSDYV